MRSLSGEDLKPDLGLSAQVLPPLPPPPHPQMTGPRRFLLQEVAMEAGQGEKRRVGRVGWGVLSETCCLGHRWSKEQILLKLCDEPIDFWLGK